MTLLDKIIEINRSIEFPKVLIGYMHNENGIVPYDRPVWICAYRNALNRFGHKPMFNSEVAIIVKSDKAIEIYKNRFGQEKQIFGADSTNLFLKPILKKYSEYNSLDRIDKLELI